MKHAMKTPEAETRRAVARLPCVCLLVAAAGCQADRPETSAGVETPVELRLDTVAIVHSDHRLFNVRQVRRRSDGGFVVMMGSLSVLLLDAAGDSVAAFGRLGDGPGEFQSMADMDTRGDSILILDGLARRVQLFHWDSLIATWSIREMATVTPQQVAFSPDGTPVVSAETRPSWESVGVMRVTRPTIEFRRVDEPGRVLDTPVEIPGTETMRGRIARGSFLAIPAFAATAVYDLTRNGVIAADARDGRVVSFSWDGEAGHALRPASPPTLVPEPELDAFWQGVRTVARRRPDPEEYLAQAGATLEVWGGSVPRPFYSAIISDGSEALIQHYSPRATSHAAEWSLLDGRGETLGTFSLTRAVRLVSLQNREVVGVGLDPMDVEHLIILRIRGALE